MSNYSTLTQNTLAGLSETAGHLYLDLLDKFEGHTKKAGERRAFFTATVFEKSVASTLNRTIDHMASCRWFKQWETTDECKAELKHFMAKRYMHSFVTEGEQ